MNINDPPHTPGPSLRQILAFRGIESSLDVQRRAYRARVERERAQLRAGEVPGVRVRGLDVRHVEVEVIELTA